MSLKRDISARSADGRRKPAWIAASALSARRLGIGSARPNRAPQSPIPNTSVGNALGTAGSTAG